MDDLAIAWRPLGELIPYARNPRTHSDAQVAQIAASIREFGWTNPVLVDGENGIIAGHGRVLAARKLQLERVPVIELAHMSEAQKRAYVLADNQLALNAGWDEALLRLELADLSELGFDLGLIGFGAGELERLLAGGKEGLTEDDEAPALPEQAVSKPGDLWVLGEHRLLCGDATVMADVERVLGGQLADMTWTDPPYNVAYGSSAKDKLRGNKRKILNDDLGSGFETFLKDACANILSVTKGAVYVCMSSSELHTLQRAFTAAGGKWSTFVIWAKHTFTLGRADYQRQYEPILYGWPAGHDRYWCGARDQGDVWFIDKPARNDLHPTMKPVALVERAIRNSSKSRDIVLDPFGGSGSTLIACEKTGRQARLVELDPKYCDVIIRRWQEWTGASAVLEGTDGPSVRSGMHGKRPDGHRSAADLLRMLGPRGPGQCTPVARRAPRLPAAPHPMLGRQRCPAPARSGRKPESLRLASWACTDCTNFVRLFRESRLRCGLWPCRAKSSMPLKIQLTTTRTSVMATTTHHPYHPIIYVRGFAATQGEIEETVADPYMGFNIGSTKARVAWTGDVKRFYFESPLVRLMSDHGYEDVFVDGDDLLAAERADHPVPYRCIVIYRYYDDASKDFGDGKTPPIEHFAKGLGNLIQRLQEKISANKDNKITPKDFRVHLVAHSMGGLVCRAFLQNPKLGSAEARGAVDKLFTYATPHNGIDMRIVRNVPGWLSFGDINNFNREKMAKYLAVPRGDDVSIVKNFPPERIFNLVGTNPRDYAVVGGVSAWAAGDGSDGLVRIENATTHGPGPDGKDVSSPRAFVHRSHSGHYGIVNSEEGYQNLTRFLFGALRVDGVLDIDDITLPVEVQKAHEEGKTVRASYQFEIVASVRGCQWQLTRREVRENSAIFRSYGELFPGEDGTKRAPDRAKSPHLFSLFLDPSKSVKASRSVSFAFDIKVLVPDYVVDGLLFLKRHYEGGFIFRDLILVEAFPDATAPAGWRIKYGYQDINPGKPGVDAETRPLTTGKPNAGIAFDIPIEQKARPGLRGTLRIEVRPWT